MTQIGNPNKIGGPDPILEDTKIMVIPAGSVGDPGLGDTTYTVPVNRGDIKAFSMYLDNNTLADLALANISVSANQTTLVNESPALKSSALYNSYSKDIICNIPEQSVIELSGKNESATDITVFFVFKYYDPYVVSLKSIM